MRCQVSSYTSEDEVSLDFRLEYMGPSLEAPPSNGNAGEPSQAAGQQLGRRVQVPVHLRLKPSLQVCVCAVCMDVCMYEGVRGGAWPCE